VLVIDDDMMTRILVIEALEPDGFNVVEASSGVEGIEAAARARPDVVLLDVSMPGMDGFECCARLRALPGGSRMPIVMLTASDDDASISRAFEAGATDFASKPMRWRLLSHRVRYLLRASAALAELARSQASLEFAERLAGVGNWEYPAGEASGHWSPEMFRILGLDHETALPGFDALLQCVPEDQRPQLIQAFTLLRTGSVGFAMEHRVRRDDGSERHLFHQGRAWSEPGGPLLLRGTVQDITERKNNEARIEYLANHDALTALPNRNLLSDRIGQAIAHARRTGSHVATLVLDLDRFKFINDSFGHPVGDALLQEVAERLRLAVREGDTVARLGGDEFVVLLTGLAQISDAEVVVQKVLTAFADAFMLEGHELRVSTSVGVSLFPEDGSCSDTLLKTADAALYSAKDRGRNCYQFYTRDMGVQVEARAEMEAALHQAVVRAEFELHYQPKVDLRSGLVYGMEALLRWRRPGVGLMPPDRFIPLAEETGLIVPIGEWVLRTACQQLRTWHQAGHVDLTMAVNVSARQFRQQNVAELVQRVLADTGLLPEFLELELTESLLMQNRDAVLASLRALKEIGVTLALDDFGTGYSSLSYLKLFPIDVVKIDQSFIRDVTNSIDGASLTRSIIAMAESLHMTTIAEGVETAGQLGFLNSNHCDAIQGYLFSRPLPSAEMALLLGAGTRLPAALGKREGAQRTLLLVDDDDRVLSSLKRLLRRDGYEILCATSGREALELMAEHPVCVIISDARMPEMQGTELLRCVRGLYPNVVRIMLSGYAELQAVTDAVNEGAVYKFLTKPWNDGLLREHVAESFRYYESASKEGRAQTDLL
jgi:diguanylate cyclase (GGDEF)-like protein/PAS domain S-box-containing protein